MPNAKENPTPKDEEKNEAPLSDESEEVEEIAVEVSGEESAAPADPQLPPPTTTAPIRDSDERTWAMLAHLSILLNLITGILGPVVALIIYLVYKDRSRYIAYQSLQSIIFQLIVWVGIGFVIGAIWLVTALLSVVLIGFLLIPFSLLATLFLLVVPFGSLIYGVYASIQCNHGADFRYWLVGDWVRGTYEDA